MVSFHKTKRKSAKRRRLVANHGPALKIMELRLRQRNYPMTTLIFVGA
jgi:hypothetical protein